MTKPSEGAMEEAEVILAEPVTMTADLCAPLSRSSRATGEMTAIYATNTRCMLSMSVLMTQRMRPGLRKLEPASRAAPL